MGVHFVGKYVVVGMTAVYGRRVEADGGKAVHSDVGGGVLGHRWSPWETLNSTSTELGRFFMNIGNILSVVIRRTD